MRRHLRADDYLRMPWVNGRGMTTELIRVAGADGGVLWRLSMASVVENGPFSLFPGIERNLTVIAGPGFDLVGARRLRADPLVPVHFAGDLPISAEKVLAPSEDFNVMTSRSLPLPEVRVLGEGEALGAGGQLAVFALAPTRIDEAGQKVVLAHHDLLLTQDPLWVLGPGQVIAVRIAL